MAVLGLFKWKIPIDLSNLFVILRYRVSLSAIFGDTEPQLEKVFKMIKKFKKKNLALVENRRKDVIGERMSSNIFQWHSESLHDKGPKLQTRHLQQLPVSSLSGFQGCNPLSGLIKNCYSKVAIAIRDRCCKELSIAVAQLNLRSGW